jgi:hypothetical protein
MFKHLQTASKGSSLNLMVGHGQKMVCRESEIEAGYVLTEEYSGARFSNGMYRDVK